MPGELTLRMITVDPDVRTTPHLLSDIGPTACSGRLAERSRLEWRYGSGGDPALLLAGFLTEAGLSIPDRSDVFVDNSAWRDIHAGVDRGVCGAAVFISAAAGAAMIGSGLMMTGAGVVTARSGLSTDS